jgi:hypothetical protein
MSKVVEQDELDERRLVHTMEDRVRQTPS